MAEGQLNNGTVSFPPVTGNIKDRPKKYWLKNNFVKFTLWLVIFLMIHGIFILILHFTLLRVTSPRYRLHSVTVEKLITDVKNKTPRFDMRLNAEVTLKNNNFGTYMFRDSNLTFSYKGTAVGQAVVMKSRTGIWSTKIMRITLNVTFPPPVGAPNSSNNYTSLVGDVTSGLVPMTVNSVLRGKVRFFIVIHKKKSTNMNCNLTVNVSQKVVQELSCR